MISPTIAKYQIIRLARDYSKTAFFIGAFILFLALSFFSGTNVQFKYMEHYLYSKAFFFNLIVCLVAGAGILGKDISDGMMSLILSKPISRRRIYLSKFVGALLIATALLLAFLLTLGLMVLLRHQTAFPLIPLLKTFAVLWIDQITLLACSIFLSSFLKDDSNAFVLLLIIILMFLVPNLPGNAPSPTIMAVLDFLIPVKSRFIQSRITMGLTIPPGYYLAFFGYLALLFTMGIAIFQKRETK